MSDINAVVPVCSLKPSPERSSSERLGREVATALAEHDVGTEIVRVADHRVRFGMSLDEVGEALQKLDYVDAGDKPDTARSTAEMALRLAHLARVLRASPYPAAPKDGD